MVKFLNTEKLKFWIKELILTSEKEVVIIVPYIKISEKMYDALKTADDRGVKLTIIYREDKLSSFEKQKIKSLNNLNLLHHPNVHCKCYYNGELIIISSMNLYEYSEKNNREMGVLASKGNIDKKKSGFNNINNNELFYDAIHEMREIMNSCEFEIQRLNTKEGHYFVSILETEEEKARMIAVEMNKVFRNKVFIPVEIKKELWYQRCKNYFDKVDVTLEENRIAIEINKPLEEKNIIYNKWEKYYDEFEFQGFKFYWNNSNSKMYLYKDTKFIWPNLDNNVALYRKYKDGIDMVISKYRKLS